ncbi:MAG: 7-cyano-7-deazaguanine synthase QueC [Proteobacteria bacterium]|jgi:7-cyano-7-deazaguanine synthase|nr:7-cyano-7-deazaguanine synthase QueC [Pseudomonadota bacterium]
MITTAIVSGGMDSIALLYQMQTEIIEVVSFDYGQRHKKELVFAKWHCDALEKKHTVIDLSSITRSLTGSALTDDSVDVPEGHYAEDNMKQTVVPNRNAVMLASAFAIAAANGSRLVATAVHAGDHFVYPDCRPEFIEAFDEMQQCALGELWDVRLHAPFAHRTKADIAKIGKVNHVPFDKTWSCYKGGDIHCGRCGTCVERREAFALADVFDPTEYADPDYWYEECKKAGTYEESQ